jgi:hypothetical protein
MIIEWIHHLFCSDTQRFPFYKDAAHVPPSANLHADLLTAYLANMQRGGINRVVLVHPEPYGNAQRLLRWA